jgi:phage gp46-like protein
MADIRTVFIDLERGADYAIESMLLQQDDGLDTAVILSLFTDRRADDDDSIPGGSDDKRGAWVDSFSDVENDKFGSRLWLLESAKLLPETVNRVREYCAEALNWMVQDGVAKAVNVTAQIIRNYPLGIIAAEIDIVKPDGTTTRYKFDKLWSAV